MFDPTAYENIKVVFEGLIYDYDLQGEILIIERNDLVNLANLSRSFNLTFTHAYDKQQFVKAKVEIHSSFEQIASEWVPFNEKPGCSLTINFDFSKPLSEIMEKRVVKILKQTFESDYEFNWMKRFYSSHQREDYQFNLNRVLPITENTIDDLTIIAETTVKTLVYLYEHMKL